MGKGGKSRRLGERWRGGNRTTLAPARLFIGGFDDLGRLDGEGSKRVVEREEGSGGGGGDEKLGAILGRRGKWGKIRGGEGGAAPLETPTYK